MQPYLDAIDDADRLLRRLLRAVPARPLRHRHHRQLARDWRWRRWSDRCSAAATSRPAGWSTRNNCSCPTSSPTSGSAMPCHPARWEGRLAQRELRDVRRVDVARPSRADADRAVCESRACRAPAAVDGRSRRSTRCSGQQLRRWRGHPARSAQDDRRRPVLHLLRHWVADNNGQSRTTEDFVALANEVVRPGPDGVLRHVAVCRRRCRRRFPGGSVADEMLEDLAPPLSVLLVRSS